MPRGREYVQLVLSVFTAADQDVCKGTSHGCHEDALCLNTHSTFTCTCLPGFTGNGGHCQGTLFCWHVQILSTHSSIISKHDQVENTGYQHAQIKSVRRWVQPRKMQVGMRVFV